MRGHGERQRRKGAEGGKIGGVQRCPVGRDHGQFLVAVGGRAAVAGDVLEDRQHAPFGQALRERAGNGGDLGGLRAKGAVADHRIGARHRHIRDRHAIDIDAHERKIGRDQPRAKPRRRKARCAIAVVKFAIGGPRRIIRPMRRAEALHAAALLVDEHRGVAADRGAEIVDQPTQRVRARDIALENDQTPWLRIAEERAFRVGQRRSGNAGYEGAHVRRLAPSLPPPQAGEGSQSPRGGGREGDARVKR